MIFGILLFLHIVVCVTLILVVLLQAGKGGGLAGAFGAAGGQTGQMLFGGRGAATFLSKATAVLGAAFLLTSLMLGILQSRDTGPGSVLDDAFEPGTVAPAVDAPPPAPEGLTIPTPGGETPGQAGEAEPGTAEPGTAEPGATQEESTPPPGDGGN